MPKLLTVVLVIVLLRVGDDLRWEAISAKSLGYSREEVDTIRMRT